MGIGKKTKEIKKKENPPPASAAKGGQKGKGATGSGELIFVFAFFVYAIATSRGWACVITILLRLSAIPYKPRYAHPRSVPTTIH